MVALVWGCLSLLPVPLIASGCATGGRSCGCGRSQLLVYHFMFGPDYPAGCPTCSSNGDGFSGSVVNLAHHDVTLCAVSRAPLAKLQAYKRRMGWSFPWASSDGSEFNYDFHMSHTNQEWQAGAAQYNFREMDFRPPAGRESSRDA